MTEVTVKRAKHITLTYSGQGKHTATWKCIDSKTVRRVIQLDQWHDTDVAAVKAAQHFVDWCNDICAERDASYSHKLDTVTLGQMDADRHSVAVTMDTQPINRPLDEVAA